MRCVLFCVNRASTDSRVSDTREPPERTNTWSMSNYPSWQVTLAIINLYWIYILEYRCTDQHDICLFYFRASSVPCLHTDCTVSTRARHIVWALTTPENGTSDTCILIAWTIDQLSNILWEGRLLQRPKQLKIINHKVNKTMHSTALSERTYLPPSRAIGKVMLPNYEVVTSSLHSNY